MTDTQYAPGIYSKGEQTRYARSASAAVSLAFDGFSRSGDLPDEVTESEASPAARPEASTPGTPARPVPAPPKSQSTEA